MGLKKTHATAQVNLKTLGWIKEARLRVNIKYDHCEFGFDEKFSNIFHSILSHEQNREMWTIVVKRTLLVLRYHGLPRRLPSSTLSTTSSLSLTLDFPSSFPPVFLALPSTLPFIQVKIVIAEKHHRKFKLYIYIAGLYCTSLMHFKTPWDTSLEMEFLSEKGCTYSCLYVLLNCSPKFTCAVDGLMWIFI